MSEFPAWLQKIVMMTQEDGFVDDLADLTTQQHHVVVGSGCWHDCVWDAVQDGHDGKCRDEKINCQKHCFPCKTLQTAEDFQKKYSAS